MMPQFCEQPMHGQNENRKKTKLPLGVEVCIDSVTGVGKQRNVHDVDPEPRVLRV